MAALGKVMLPTTGEYNAVIELFRSITKNKKVRYEEATVDRLAHG